MVPNIMLRCLNSFVLAGLWKYEHSRHGDQISNKPQLVRLKIEICHYEGEERLSHGGGSGLFFIRDGDGVAATFVVVLGNYCVPPHCGVGILQHLNTAGCSASYLNQIIFFNSLHNLMLVQILSARDGLW